MAEFFETCIACKDSIKITRECEECNGLGYILTMFVDYLSDDEPDK